MTDAAAVQSNPRPDEAMMRPGRLSAWHVAYALNMAVACAISYWVMTQGLAQWVSRDSDLLGGMWAAVATMFVFRPSREDSLSAGASRLIATGVSFALCLVYLWFFPFTVPGLAALILAGTVVMVLLDRQDDIVTTGITTIVVMVVAAISPAGAWHQPLLRLVDTLVGVGIGVAGKWLASFLYVKLAGEKPR
jgi:uncharacterized membrane protein YccC